MEIKSNIAWFLCTASHLKEARELAIASNKIFARKYNVMRVVKNEKFEDVIELINKHYADKSKEERPMRGDRVGVFILERDQYLFYIDMGVIEYKRNRIFSTSKLLVSINHVITAYSNNSLSRGHIELLKEVESALERYIKGSEDQEDDNTIQSDTI